MQMELKDMHKTLGITFIYVTHDQEEALTLSDSIVVMSEGRVQQIGTPTDIYNEPVNSFVADFIGESNILNGVMVHDRLVRFMNRDFECVDAGFGENAPVDVVIRPEDVYIMAKCASGMFEGVVQSCIFKGVHYEMIVLTPDGYEIMIQDYNAFEVGQEVSLIVKPSDIHVMQKERITNTFEGTMVDATHINILGTQLVCNEQPDVAGGEKIEVEVDFEKIELMDNKEDDMLVGDVRFILYKGDHYHLTVRTEGGDNIYVDTHDVWDDRDIVGVKIQPDDMRIKRV
jgi:spermidine/putrescine transport system ATP-binding protein